MSIAKAGLQFLKDLFIKKFLFIQPNFQMTFFCHCTNSLSSLHISIHHCTFCASLHVKTSPGPSSAFDFQQLLFSVPHHATTTEYQFTLPVACASRWS